ncbi:hypothetical protein [Brevibacillus laterosporus]|uniref:Uncharacterized protein n=1 Tax=Brevibacillus laterosporus TaxID=1465 RepID=A0AAP8QH68_BRELA|nr:hypothetical protein [Brevibacillus laterosporus]MBG9776154.1 hypothetical protein [Brevibacillus laterosporus]MED1665722.1 hypothetical protein [Brevibacillus laterosporus]MED1667189.1 hypothetical protein [Brevibacillus laterosporus]MED1719743.1 hypothetical protein [Brevibacillus laterosporus]PPB12875.1 hypothetical protein C4A77_00380 [Brevibacillus laterosporus]
MKKTRESLIEKGFTSAGILNGCEYLAKKLDDDGFAYFMIAPNGQVLSEIAHTSSIEQVYILNAIKEKLYG